MPVHGKHLALRGQDGQLVTSRNLRDRLEKELLTNVSLRAGDGLDRQLQEPGRGGHQLAILIEMMRREGFEMMVSRPEIVTQRIDGQLMEPVYYIDVPQEFVGVVTGDNRLAQRRVTNMHNHGYGRVRIEFRVPSRGFIRTAYHRHPVRHHRYAFFDGYTEWQGEIPHRLTGADRPGTSTAYALWGLQARELFVGPASISTKA